MVNVYEYNTERDNYVTGKTVYYTYKLYVIMNNNVKVLSLGTI